MQSTPERMSKIGAESHRLLFADLHNHSLLSDGAGDPAHAFAAMRAAGLDVAALTDHASIPAHSLPDGQYPGRTAEERGLQAPPGFDRRGWDLIGRLAGEADEPGVFTAFRGFEWSEPWLGHANVWFTDEYQQVHTPGSMQDLHEFLIRHPEALFGYNHPGREPGRFCNFAYVPALQRRMVTLEMFNRYDDFLFRGWAEGRPSPLVQCLAQGWLPGLVGSSDEHGTAYGLIGKGRTGIWAAEHSRRGLRAALSSRRTYATREVGLRLDATMAGVPMGGRVAACSAGHRIDVDLGGPYEGLDVDLQLLVPGDDDVPSVHAVAPATVGTTTRLDVALPEGTAWAVLRVADGTRANATPGPPGHLANAYGLAYASPWFIDHPLA